MAIKQEEIELTVDQETIVKAFLKKYPNADRFTAVKFCFGRKFEVHRVFPLYEAYLQVIQERKLAGIGAVDVLPEMKTQKMYIPGSRDRKGAALFVVQAAKHVPGQFPPESTLKLAFFLGEVITASLKTQRNGISLLIDLHETEWSSFDATFMADLIGFFQNHIPAAVKNILIWRAPWWIKSAIKIVSPFLKEKMRRRIKLCDNFFALKAFVDEDQLPVEFGGTFEYDHEAFIRRQLTHKSNEGILASFATASFSAAEAAFEGGNEGSAILLSGQSRLLVSPDDEKLLQDERLAALKLLDDRLQQLKNEPPETTDFPVPIYDVLNSRACRMTLDVTAYFKPIEGQRDTRKKSLSEETWLEIRAEADENIQILRMKEALLHS